MIAFLGALLGFAGSLMPEIMKIFQDRRDKGHEVILMEKQAQLGAQLREYDAKIMDTQAEASFLIQEQDRIANQVKNDKTGIWWVDASNAMVRPVIAYGFFALYSFIKIYTLFQMDLKAIVQGTPWNIWTDEDAMIFSAIISFYFGSRAMKRTMGRG